MAEVWELPTAAVSFEELRRAIVEDEAALAMMVAKEAEQIFGRGILIRPNEEDVRQYG